MGYYSQNTALALFEDKKSTEYSVELFLSRTNREGEICCYFFYFLLLCFIVCIPSVYSKNSFDILPSYRSNPSK